MYTIKFGRGWKHSATAQTLKAAVSIAYALSSNGWGVHVTDQDGNTVPWKHR